MDDGDNVFDYPMSDAFVSETARHPYRIGFRPRQHSAKPSIKELLALPDRDFQIYIRNGCRMPNAKPDLRAEINELRQEQEHQRQQIAALEDLVRKLQNIPGKSPKGSFGAGSKGLNVEPRA